MLGAEMAPVSCKLTRVLARTTSGPSHQLRHVYLSIKLTHLNS